MKVIGLLTQVNNTKKVFLKTGLTALLTSSDTSERLGKGLTVTPNTINFSFRNKKK